MALWLSYCNRLSHIRTFHYADMQWNVTFANMIHNDCCSDQDTYQESQHLPPLQTTCLRLDRKCECDAHNLNTEIRSYSARLPIPNTISQSKLYTSESPRLHRNADFSKHFSPSADIQKSNVLRSGYHNNSCTIRSQDIVYQ